jgi:hypothetical protein
VVYQQGGEGETPGDAAPTLVMRYASLSIPIAA